MSSEKIINPVQQDDIDNLLKQFPDVAVNGFHHPNFDPVALHLGPLELRWYSLAYLFGIIIGWIYINYLNKKYDKNYLTPEAMEAIPMWIILSVVLGGRIGYVLFYNIGFYSDNLVDVFKIWKGGMSFHGGLIGVLVGTALFCRYYKLQFFRVTDLLAMATPIGLFFGRLANFVNKELIGKETTVSWGVIYPKEDFARHPSQLYEAWMEGVMLFLILYACMRLFNLLERKAALSGIFLIFYGIFRVIAEIFRQPDRQIGYIYEHISMGQILCIPMILAGVIILLLSKRTEAINN